MVRGTVVLEANTTELYDVVHPEDRYDRSIDIGSSLFNLTLRPTTWIWCSTWAKTEVMFTSYPEGSAGTAAAILPKGAPLVQD